MLEIEEDLPLQRVTWRMQRVGWVLAVAVLVIASAGLLGGSRSPNQTVELPGLSVAYSSPQRQGAESQIIVRFIDRKDIADDSGSLFIGDAFLSRVRNLEFTPTPVESVSEPGRLRVRFAALPSKVTLDFTPVEWGRLPLSFGISPELGTHDAYVLP